MTPDDQLAAILAEVTYRPGWRFEVARGIGTFMQDTDVGPVLPMLIVSADVPDVRDPETTTRISHYEAVPLLALSDPPWVLSLVDRVVARLEAHERHEWLRFRGEPVIDPHPPDERGVPGFVA